MGQWQVRAGGWNAVRQRAGRCWELKKGFSLWSSLDVLGPDQRKSAWLLVWQSRLMLVSLGFTFCQCVCIPVPLWFSVCPPLCLSASPVLLSTPRCLSLSLGVPHFLPTCISVSDNLIGFRSVHILSFQSPPNGTPSSLLSTEDEKTSVWLTCRTFRKLFFQCFPSRLARENKGGKLKSPLRCLPKQMSSLPFCPNAETASALKIPCFHLLKEICQSFNTGCLWVARNALVLFISSYFFWVFQLVQDQPELLYHDKISHVLCTCQIPDLIFTTTLISGC